MRNLLNGNILRFLYGVFLMNCLACSGAKTAELGDAALDLGSTNHSRETGINKDSLNSTSDATSNDHQAPAIETVLFTTNKYSGMTFETVKIDGTNHQTLSAPPADVNLKDLIMPGLQSPFDIRRDLPTHVAAGSSLAYLLLPQKKGQLYRWKDPQTYEEGLGIFRRDGTFYPLDSGKGLSAYDDVFQYTIPISADGSFAAAVKFNKTLLFFHTDGTKWSKSQSPALDVSAKDWSITKILGQSLTLGTKRLFFIAEEGSMTTKRELYTAALDGSSLAAKVLLPQVNNVDVTYISDTIAISDDQKTIAFLAGTSATKTVIATYKEGGSPVITSVPLDHYFPRGYGMMAGFNPRLSVANSGNVAFSTTETAQNKNQAWVITSKGNKIQLNSSGRFSSDVIQFGGFYWADDDNLLFWAGVSSEKADLFHYKVSTDTLNNLSKTGKNSTEPWDSGTLICDGAWIAPNHEFLYYVAGQYDPNTKQRNDMNLYGINLKTFARIAITNGLHIPSTRLDLEFEGTQGVKQNMVWFKAVEGTGAVQNVYVFDQNAGTPAQKITQLENPGVVYTIENLLVSPDGKNVAYTGGYDDKIYVVPTQAGKPRLLYDSKVSIPFQWTASSDGIVFGGGNLDSSKRDVMFVSLASGTPTTLHSAQSYILIHSVGN